MGVTMPGKFLSKVNYLMDLELLEGPSTRRTFHALPTPTEPTFELIIYLLNDKPSHLGKRLS